MNTRYLYVKSVWPSLRVCVVVVAIEYKTEHIITVRYMYIALGAIYRLACSIGCLFDFDF